MARKIEEPHEGYLYRVVQRLKGSEDVWVHSAYGTVGRPRTYMTLSAAKGQKTSFERLQDRTLAAQADAVTYRSPEFLERMGWPSPELEFKVQRMPVDNWEDAE